MRRSALIAVAVAMALSLTVAGCSKSGGGSKSRGSATAAVTSTGTAPVSSAVPATSILATGTLKALSYNVAGLPLGLSSSSPQLYTTQISPKLNTYDLVLVQEDFSYHTDLQQHAAHAHQSLPLAQFASLVNDGLNRFSQTPYVDFVRERWSVCNGLWNASNDCLSSKGFSVARHELAPGAEVDIYNLHADAGGSAADQNARTVQLAQLATFVQSYSAGRAVIVAGDTNLKRRIAADERVLLDFAGGLNLEDVGQLMGMPDHIDRFFFRSSPEVELKPVLWRVADEMVDPSGANLSDHPAINVDFEWRKLR
jgi:hypothetical protein